MHHLEELSNGNVPVITAFLLGIVTSIHPCPLTLNITAIGYIGNDLEKKNAVFARGISYTLGRIFTYTLLASIIYLGADMLKISEFFRHYGNALIAPFLILMGVLMLDIIPLRFSVLDKLTSAFTRKIKNKHYNSFLLGVVYSFVFCPHTVVFYFGMLIPLAMTSSGGFVLPVVYAVGTGFPVLLVSWILTYSMQSIGSFYARLKKIEKRIRIITAIMFIFVGLYFLFSVNWM